MKTLKTLLTIVLSVFLSLNFCYGEQNILKKEDFIKLTALAQFIGRPEGDVAFLPGVGHQKYSHWAREHLVLPVSGFYKLPRKGNYFFRVNHASDAERTSYLGVTVYLLYPPGSGQKKSFYLIRNKADWQPGKDRKLSKQLEGPTKFFPRDITPFFDAHKPDQDLKQCDEILTFTWHAADETGSFHSWDFRSKWYKANPESQNLAEFLKVLELPQTGYNVAINAYILHFTTSTNPKNHLDFWFNADHAMGAYVSIFSPLGTQYDKDFFFQFE